MAGRRGASERVLARALVAVLAGVALLFALDEAAVLLQSVGVLRFELIDRLGPPWIERTFGSPSFFQDAGRGAAGSLTSVDVRISPSDAGSVPRTLRVVVTIRGRADQPLLDAVRRGKAQTQGADLVYIVAGDVRVGEQGVSYGSPQIQQKGGDATVVVEGSAQLVPGNVSVELTRAGQCDLTTLRSLSVALPDYAVRTATTTPPPRDLHCQEGSWTDLLTGTATYDGQGGASLALGRGGPPAQPAYDRPLIRPGDLAGRLGLDVMYALTSALALLLARHRLPRRPSDTGRCPRS